MTYYEKLTSYFPEHEMKARSQLEALLERNEAYGIDETDDYLVLYAELEDCLFIDYLLVADRARGKGVGSRLMRRLQAKAAAEGKTIVLEVEPVDETDEDTAKRLAFYRSHGFRPADRVVYERTDGEGVPYTLDVLYWCADAESLSQRDIYEQMRRVCRDIHNFRAMRVYGRLPADPDEVLRFRAPAKPAAPLVREPALAGWQG
ncbi:GNAT family N-acetyltransferase [Paenibacillus sp. TRM 82003]|nr:GNAT family N-acetyltransferase [Paenibacillus sp. TRM 82003]